MLAVLQESTGCILHPIAHHVRRNIQTKPPCEWLLVLPRANVRKTYKKRNLSMQMYIRHI